MKIAVCDDETKILEDIKGIILKLYPEDDVNLFSSGEVFLGSGEKPDVLLLDIDMPGMSGMDVASKLAEKETDALIVFVTAHDELVYDSFKYHPFAFVRKTYLQDELSGVLKDCRLKIDKKNKHYVFKTGSETVSLSLDEILYFESLANYLTIKTKTLEYKTRSTISGVESELGKNDFLRIHKGFLVNLEHIKTVKSDELLLDNDEVLPIGKSYSEEARRVILKYMRR
ncbi:MAG: response regulator transcription factor [Lachnospiraceae bacterium]|nr:response regulator transcription factor [Lachnospiraceae bacterium]